MTLPIYLFKKLLNAIFICGVVSFSIFFLFSLIGNLGEKFTFGSILYLSILNSLQIFTYIPSHLFILSICLFILSLKSKNELIIIKEYVKLTSLFIIIIPFLLTFVFIEFNKNIASSNIETIKSNLISSKNLKNMKIIINSDGDKKTYKIFNKRSQKDINSYQYLSYQLNNQSIIRGELSSNIDLDNNDLIVNDYTIYENNNFRYENSEKKLFDFQNIWSDKSKTIVKNNIDSLNSNYSVIQSIIFYSLFYLCISMVFLSKKFVNKSFDTLRIFFLVLSVFLYYLLVPKIMLNNFQNYFQLISPMVLLLIFLKLKKYE